MKDTEKIEEFYTNQNILSGGLYTRNVGKEDRERLDFIYKSIGKKTKEILELGAGGGQFAFLAAQDGHSVAAIESNPHFAKHAKHFANSIKDGSLEIFHEDFHNIKLNRTFDLIVYWDGFGIGTDDDQKLLLKKIYGWLKQDGVAFIDIYTPWNAILQNGVEMELPGTRRKYGYDAENNRWLDTWWSIDNPQKQYTQSLRCYTPADLKLLLDKTQLKLESFTIGPYFDRETSKYHKIAPSLEKSIWFTAKLVRDSSVGLRIP